MMIVSHCARASRARRRRGPHRARDTLSLSAILFWVLQQLLQTVDADPSDMFVGAIIGLHSTAHNRFVRMNDDDGKMDASSEKDWNQFPTDWTSERFRVVDVGGGDIALDRKSVV